MVPHGLILLLYSGLSFSPSWALSPEPTLLSLSPKTMAVSIALGLLLPVSYGMGCIRKGRINPSRETITSLIP